MSGTRPEGVLSRAGRNRPRIKGSRAGHESREVGPGGTGNQVEAFYRVAVENRRDVSVKRASGDCALENPVVWNKYEDKETLESYKWSNPVQSAVATREALFTRDVPWIIYDS